MSFPNFPGSAIPAPETFKQTLVAECIHALPKSFMPKSSEFAIGREALQSVDFQTAAVAVEIPKNLRLTDEKPAIDPSFADLRFLCEVGNHVAVENQTTKASGWSHG